MLILILGPSGVGKTTVIQELVVKHQWIPITSYITRPSREDEKYKTTIPMAEYEILRSSEKLFSDIEQLGHAYGTLAADINLALSAREPYVIDFSYTKRVEVFGHIPHLAVALLPESTAELVRRLSEAGRASRTAQALEDLAALEKEIRLSSQGGIGISLTEVLNKRGEVTEAANHIQRLADQA
jgi:guanylate kinase